MEETLLFQAPRGREAEIPSVCPVCNKQTSPQLVTTSTRQSCYRCGRAECQSLFLIECESASPVKVAELAPGYAELIAECQRAERAGLPELLRLGHLRAFELLLRASHSVRGMSVEGSGLAELINASELHPLVLASARKAFVESEGDAKRALSAMECWLSSEIELRRICEGEAERAYAMWMLEQAEGKAAAGIDQSVSRRVAMAQEGSEQTNREIEDQVSEALAKVKELKARVNRLGASERRGGKAQPEVECPTCSMLRKIGASASPQENVEESAEAVESGEPWGRVEMLVGKAMANLESGLVFRGAREDAAEVADQDEDSRR